ncbi:MAG: hypothetical protein K6F56_04255 [Oscillospiraceae bacterium]|nr:hypothetical protein [Oscillospiraceae bacterium]
MKRESMDSFAQNLEKAAVILILVLLAVFLLGLVYAAYTQTSDLNTNDVSGEHIDFKDDNIFLNGILTAIGLCALYLFYRHCGTVPLRRMERVLLLFTFVFGAAFIASTKLEAPIYSDSYLVTFAAQRAAAGDYSQLADAYFRRFPFQLGYVLYSELFFHAVRLVLRSAPEGYRWLALQGVNLLWLLLAYHAIVEISGLLFHRPRVQKLTMLLLFVCLQPVLSVTFLYGNTPAFACGTAALWMFLLFLERGRTRYALLTALLLSLAVALKLNLLIFCVAVGGVWVIELFKKRSLRSLLCLLLAAACVLTIPKLPQRIYEKRTGLAFGEGIPMIAWMAMGFDQGYAAPGWYREYHTVAVYIMSGEDAAVTEAEAKEYLTERLQEFRRKPAGCARFFWQKLCSQWNEPSYESLWVNQVQLSFSEKGRFYDFLCGSGARRTAAFMNQVQQLILLGALLGMPGLWRRKRIRQCLLPVIVLGGLLYHLLFEAKSQYALPYFVLLVPLAAWGLSRLFHRIEHRHEGSTG